MKCVKVENKSYWMQKRMIKNDFNVQYSRQKMGDEVDITKLFIRNPATYKVEFNPSEKVKLDIYHNVELKKYSYYLDYLNKLL